MPPLQTEPALLAFPQLAALCQDNGVQSLALFGSHLHGNAHAQSNIDLLVQFLPGQRVTLLDMVRIEMDLTDKQGKDMRCVSN